jgi:cytochrome c oxidase subunit 2
VPLESGGIVTADEQYIRDSILLPQKQIAAGYPHIMPTFQNVLGEDDVLRLVAYIKSLDPKTGRATQ